MFSLFSSREIVPQLNVDELLTPFLYLNESLINAEKGDSQAVSKKYLNDGHGVPRAVSMKLNAIAIALLNNEFS